MAKTPSMEDILSSIRDTVEEETSKTVGLESAENSAPEVDAEDNSSDTKEAVTETVESPDNEPEEDILDLSIADEVIEPETLTEIKAEPVIEQSMEDETLIDIETFAKEAKTVIVGEEPAEAEEKPEEKKMPAVEENKKEETEATEGVGDSKAEETSADEAKTKEEKPAEDVIALDPEKSDEDVAAEIDALLAEVKQEDANDEFPKMEAPAEEPVAENAEPDEAKAEETNEEDAPAEDEAKEPAENKEENLAKDAVDDVLAAAANSDGEAMVDIPDIEVSEEEETGGEEVDPTPVDGVEELLKATDKTEEVKDSQPEEETASDSADDIMAEMGALPEATEGKASAENETVEETVAEIADTPATATPSPKVKLEALPSASGLQVAFPAEVLAEALRPLVKDWVAENLPDLVETLVKEELSKLTE